MSRSGTQKYLSTLCVFPHTVQYTSPLQPTALEFCIRNAHAYFVRKVQSASTMKFKREKDVSNNFFKRFEFQAPGYNDKSGCHLLLTPFIKWMLRDKIFPTLKCRSKKDRRVNV